MGRKEVKSISRKVEEYTNGFTKEYKFNYGFYVNQKIIVDNRWDVDIIDIAIFYAIKKFIAYIEEMKAKNQQTDFDNNSYDDELGRWYFISENKIIKDMPILPLSSESGVYKRIMKLVECGLIERNPKNAQRKKKHIRLGKNSSLFDEGVVKVNE